MNARQKAKYYKRKYEELVSMPLIFKPLPEVTLQDYLNTMKHYGLSPEELFENCYIHGDEDRTNEER